MSHCQAGSITVCFVGKCYKNGTAFKLGSRILVCWSLKSNYFKGNYVREYASYHKFVCARTGQLCAVTTLPLYILGSKGYLFETKKK